MKNKELYEKLQTYWQYMDEETKQMVINIRTKTVKLWKIQIKLSISMTFFESACCVFFSIHFQRFGWVEFILAIGWLIWSVITIIKYRKAQWELKRFLN